MKRIFILISITMCIAFTSDVFASDFDFYGSVRFDTMSEKLSNKTGKAKDEGDRDLKWGLRGNSRLGARIEVSDKLTGLFELGAGDETLSLRDFYGVYDFGAASILIGQTDNPINGFAAYSSQIGLEDDGLGVHGGFDGGKNEMIKFIFDNFQLAFIEPVTLSTGINPDNTELFDKKFPQISAGYSFEYENFTFDTVANYQKYEEENATTGQTYNVDSYAVKFGIRGEFGPFMLGATYGRGENVANMGINAATYYFGGAPVTPKPVFDKGVFYDKDTDVYTIVTGYKANDVLKFEAGYGHVENEDNNPIITDKDKASAYYLQSEIKVKDGFTLTPEIGKVDYGTYQGGDDGEIEYLGVKCQFDF